MSIEPVAVDAPIKRAAGSRSALSDDPRRRVAGSAMALRLVTSRTVDAKTSGRQPEPAPDDAADEAREDDAWLKVPKGIALGALLGLGFWTVLAALLVWLLR